MICGNRMDNRGRWKISNILNHGCVDMSHMPTRPPWRPAAASVSVTKEGPPPTPTFWPRQKSTEITVAPQYVSAEELVAAMPKRTRMPPQGLSTKFCGGAAETPTGMMTPIPMGVRTPKSPGVKSITSDRFDKRGTQSASGSPRREEPKRDRKASPPTPPTPAMSRPRSPALSYKSNQEYYAGGARSQQGSPPSAPRSGNATPTPFGSRSETAITPTTSPRITTGDTSHKSLLPSRGRTSCTGGGSGVTPHSSRSSGMHSNRSLRVRCQTPGPGSVIHGGGESPTSNCLTPASVRSPRSVASGAGTIASRAGTIASGGYCTPRSGYNNSRPSPPIQSRGEDYYPEFDV